MEQGVGDVQEGRFTECRHIGAIGDQNEAEDQAAMATPRGAKGYYPSVELVSPG